MTTEESMNKNANKAHNLDQCKGGQKEYFVRMSFHPHLLYPLEDIPLQNLHVLLQHLGTLLFTLNHQINLGK